MAVKTFDEMYSQLSADEKKVFDNAIARNPELKAGWLRQDDYSRKMTEIQQNQTKLTELEEYKARMEPWSARAYELTERLQTAGVIDDELNEKWTAQKDQLEQDLEEARKAAVAGGEMKPEELDARVREIVKAAGGGLTRDEITALYQSETKKMVEDGFKAREADFNSKTIPFIAGFSSAVAVVAARYERESGEKFTPEDQERLFKLMNEKQVFDPYKLEDDFMAPVKAKKDQARLIEEEVQKRLATVRKMPGGGGEEFIPQPGEPVGALQKALQDSAGGGDFEATIRARAVEAANALRQEGKA